MKCPCANTKDDKPMAYSECCEPFHLGQKPTSAEQLMRSRYSAFYLANGQYILDTHHRDFRDNDSVDDYTQSAKATNWCRLEVLESQQFSDSATVEFKAYFISGDKLHSLHEISNFVLLEGQWLYTDGLYQPRSVSKIQRNDPCPCQSGVKAKKCCLS